MLETLNTHSVTPYRDRPYEWVAGTADFGVDPARPANSRIVDLEAAPRDARGRVTFNADIRMLRPTGGGNGRTLVVIPNRGLLGGLPFSLGAPLVMGPPEDPDPGDGFLLERGWTIAWCGWQWDVRRDQGGLGLDAPLAAVAPGPMRIEFRPDAAQDSHALSDSSPFFSFAEYPPTEGYDDEAVLAVRTSPLGPRTALPRSSWQFDPDAGVVLAGGFQAFHFYDLTYRSAHAPVVGCGLLAVRDFAAWLGRDGAARFAFGVSQSGRFLRQFLHEGLNVDEDGDPVFDGVFAHIASARRGEFNMRYGQPSLTHPLTPGYGPPYDTTALLAGQRRVGGVPKLFLTNSSWEYWRGDGALVHQDAATGDDLPDDPDARAYLIAGTDHFGAIPFKEMFPAANPVHTLDASPVLRALIVALEQWACDGVEPPASCVPRRADATAVTPEEVLSRFPAGVVPDPAHLPWTPAIDASSTTWPLELGAPTVALVAAVDEGGNETAGVRLPAVARPRAAFTGWNPRVAVDGLPGVLYEFLGSRLALLVAAPEMSRDDYERELRDCAAHLVDARLLLPLDVDRVVGEALAVFDSFEPGSG